MQKELDEKWPSFSISKYMIRILNALESQPETVSVLSDVSGYSGDTYQVKKNLVDKLVGSGLVESAGDEYIITSDGRDVLQALLDYRDIEVLDARELDQESSFVRGSGGQGSSLF